MQTDRTKESTRQAKISQQAPLNTNSQRPSPHDGSQARAWYNSTEVNRYADTKPGGTDMTMNRSQETEQAAIAYLHVDQPRIRAESPTIRLLERREAKRHLLDALWEINGDEWDRMMKERSEKAEKSLSGKVENLRTPLGAFNSASSEGRALDKMLDHYLEDVAHRHDIPRKMVAGPGL